MPIARGRPIISASQLAPRGTWRPEHARRRGRRGPASVIALFRDALDAYTRPREPRWRALEHMLTSVVAYWQSLPGQPDPVFARGGWRCAVPVCSGRRNLHDHHVQYRSRGGSNALQNRVAVCAAHHLHGIHAGTIRAWGTAPNDIHWEIGVRSNAPPLLSFVGERRHGDGDDQPRKKCTDRSARSITGAQ